MNVQTRILGGSDGKGTFSTMSIAMGIMATSLLVVQNQEEKPLRTEYKLEWNLPSYQEAEIRIASYEAELSSALQGVYEGILSNQTDFDDQTKKVIYDNLWNLYS